MFGKIFLQLSTLSLFHTVQPGFVAQTGDPTGKGRGGESIFAQLYGEQVYFNQGIITLVTIFLF